MILAILSGWLLLGGTIALYALLGRAIDQVLARQWQLGELLAVGAAIVLARTAIAAFQRMAAFRAAASRKNELRQSIYRKLLQLGPEHAKSERTGALVTECVEGVEALDAFYGIFIPQLVVGFSAPLLICAWLAGSDWVTGLALFAAAPIPPLLMMIARRRFRDVSRRYYAAMGQLSARFLDSVHGLPTLKLFGRGREAAVRIRDDSESLRRETMRLLATNQLVIFFIDWGFAISATTVAAAVGILRWQQGALSAGGLFVAVLLSTEIVRQINLVAAFFFAGAGGRVVLKKIESFLALPPAVADDPAAVAPARFVPSIRFDRVSFQYDEDAPPVFDAVTFDIAPGEVVGIVGPSGAGKTTLLNLLLRFADPTAGEILFSGRPLANLPLQWLRRRIALVAQDPHLFHGSIRDNLLIARPNASSNEMERAARDAGLHEFIRSLSDGYDTQLGERAVRLSGGQMQRLAIARAFLQDAPILLLDEATANLDAGNEAVIGDALRRLRHGRTTLIVAHRAGALRDADRLLVLRDGGIEPLSLAEPHLLVT